MSEALPLDEQAECLPGDHVWFREGPDHSVGLSGYLECKLCGFQKDDEGELDGEFDDNYF